MHKEAIECVDFGEVHWLHLVGEIDVLFRFVDSIQAQGYDETRIRAEFPSIKFTANPTIVA